MASKSTIVINPLQPPVVYVEHTPLADVDFKITDPMTEFILLELHCWSQEKSLDQTDDVCSWESNFPKYVVPHTHPCLEVIRLFQSCYSLDQRAIVNSEKEVLFTITTESINQMPQLKPSPNEIPLSIEALMKFYLKLYFPKGFQIFQAFMTSYVEIPKLNPP